MMPLSLIAAGAVVMLTSFAHILLKKGANTPAHLIFNRYVISGYSCLVLVVLLSAFLMRMIEFKYFSIVSGLSYVVTTLLAALILKEKVTVKAFFGCSLVLTGSVLFSL